ncbi:lipoprotein [Sphaerotilus montanus]|uniref:Putative small lipoprotein YifL n=1 Tax=Sphaerotilus montanus TaxID=522889 RepID=A0A7Y9QXC4_9BURK|nr:lipoprotein [Sphaerotilus montanus]NYG31719.1 putative small lipoprotein YifL [Sphaerotilus montanus]NZD56475.1 lipoprotein [Sphaerotilus montanus]
MFKGLLKTSLALRASAVCALLLSLSACGQKGPLTLPPQGTTPSILPVPAAAAASASTPAR